MRYLTAFALSLIVIFAASSAQAWELRVCAPPDNFPVSSDAESGYENLIAEVLADELGANLTYEWLVLNRQTVAYEMNAGKCDVALGVADGAGGLISTIAYYSTPYVFVFRTDGPELTGALDDPALEGLRLATYPNSLSDNALRQHGHGDSIVHVEPVPRNLSHDYTAPILEALEAGRIDAALLEGARTGHHVLNSDNLELRPVAPLITGSLMQLYRNSTLAVRAGDESLRDQLNIALAARWDEIQGILSDFGVPLLESRPPALPHFPAPDAVIGLVLPTPSQVPAETDATAQAARDGARLGDDLAAQSSDLTVHLRRASAPSAAAAARASARLVALDGARILVGGIGVGQAESMATVAEETATPFISLDPAGPGYGATSFSVAADITAYLEGLLGHVGPKNWYVVADQPDLPTVTAQIEAAGGTVAGSQAVAGPTLIYYDLLSQIDESEAEAVLLLLSNSEQEQFLSQASIILPNTPVYSVTDLTGQAREYLLRWRTAAPQLAETPRIALWEPAAPVAEELSSRYLGRTGKPFDPAAWAGFAALTIAHDSLSANLESPITHLQSGAEFEVGKDRPASFDPESRLLHQDLYLITISPDAAWSISPSDQLDLGRYELTLPAGN